MFFFNFHSVGFNRNRPYCLVDLKQKETAKNVAQKSPSNYETQMNITIFARHVITRINHDNV